MVELDLHVAQAHRRACAAVRAELGFDEVRIADEVGDEAVARRLIKLARPPFAILAFDMTMMRSETASASC